MLASGLVDELFISNVEFLKDRLTRECFTTLRSCSKDGI